MLLLNNCLLYKQGDINDALCKLEQLVNDKKLQEKLIKNGLKTVKEYSWENIEEKIFNLYVWGVELNEI